MDLVIFNKAAAFCAYQERSHQEVRERLRKWEVWGQEADEIIAELIVGNYLNEERFAKAYAGGKSRIKHWGKLKIKQELKRRGVSDYSIGAGMNEISPGDYKEGLRSLLVKKYPQLRRTDSDPRVIEMKLIRFSLGKGYEMDLVRETVREVMTSLSSDS
jgi:regulatory protein